MSGSVVSRAFSSTPHRDAIQTWNAIVDLLTQGKAGGSRSELLAVSGIAASVIADQYPKDAAIVVTCEGPRTRIYCIYDDAAIDGTDSNEDVLGFNPLNGNWCISLPCQADDLAWVQSALKKQSTRITARNIEESVTPVESPKATKSQALNLDPKEFLGP